MEKKDQLREIWDWSRCFMVANRSFLCVCGGCFPKKPNELKEADGDLWETSIQWRGPKGQHVVYIYIVSLMILSQQSIVDAVWLGWLMIDQTNIKTWILRTNLDPMDIWECVNKTFDTIVSVYFFWCFVKTHIKKTWQVSTSQNRTNDRYQKFFNNKHMTGIKKHVHKTSPG